MPPKDIVDSFDIEVYTKELARSARQAVSIIAAAPGLQKNHAINLAADLIDKQRADLISANQKDLEIAKHNNLATPLLDRLALNNEIINSMIVSLRQVASLQDPIGEISEMRYMPSGIKVGKMRVPLGVVGIIYESRPNVTSEAASLSLKSGNVCILRGGSEAINSNLAIANIMQEALTRTGLPSEAITQVQSTDRNLISILISNKDYIDVLIPRGGKGLIERISKESKVNIIKHLDGNCHVYVDKNANLAMALKIVVNAKTRRYGVCNAMESLLVHRQVASDFLPQLAQKLQNNNIELRSCPYTYKILPDTKQATENDWSEEYLAPILSIKVVQDLNEAIVHINKYGSHHTDAIVTDHYPSGEQFIRDVDSSSVMWNASTGFADGFEYGLGAEVGISTDKFHARGPVGLEGLTCQKFVVMGTGNIRG